MLIARPSLRWTLGSVLALSAAALPLANAQDFAQPGQDLGNPGGFGKPEPQPQPVAPSYDYTPPADGKPQDVLNFMAEARNQQPTAQTLGARLSGLEQAFQMIASSTDASVDQKAKAAELFYGDLGFFAQRVGAREGQQLLGKMHEIANGLKQSDNATLQDLGFVFAFQNSTFGLNPQTGEGFDNMYDTAKAFLRSGDLDLSRARVAMAAAQMLANGGQDEKAIQAFDEFSTAFENSGRLIFMRAAEQMRQMSKRLKVRGQKIELGGETLDGSKFDWSSYKGKIVLVDFWASWCGPCRQTMPRFKETYDKFHKDGFEILGVNLDDPESFDAARKFASSLDLPWKHLINSDPAAAGWDNPLVEKFGVSAIPSTLLVDREGTVVALDIMGDQLDQQLTKMLEDEKAAVDKPAEKPEDATPEKPETEKPESEKPESSPEE